MRDRNRCCLHQQPDEAWPETMLVIEEAGKRFVLGLSLFLQRPCALASIWPSVVGITDARGAEAELKAAALIEGYEWEEERHD